MKYLTRALAAYGFLVLWATYSGAAAATPGKQWTGDARTSQPPPLSAAVLTWLHERKRFHGDVRLIGGTVEIHQERGVVRCSGSGCARRRVAGQRG
jgi:hypothetical protein